MWWFGLSNAGSRNLLKMSKWPSAFQAYQPGSYRATVGTWLVTPTGGGRLAALGNSTDNSLSMLHCASCFCEEVWSNDEYSTCSIGDSWLNKCIRDPDVGDVVHVSKMSLACSLHVCLLPPHPESQQKSNWTRQSIFLFLLLCTSQALERRRKREKVSKANH
jgi:hypothetical protein